MAERGQLRRSALVALLLGLCACDSGTGPDDSLAGAWTLHLVDYVSSAVLSYSTGRYEITTQSCAGAVPVRFYDDGSGTRYIVKVPVTSGICETVRTQREPGSPEVTSPAAATDFSARDLRATIDGSDIALSDGSLTMAGTLASTQGETVVSNGSISGSASDPGPITYTWSAGGSWTMDR